MIMEAIFGGDMYPLENIVPQQDGYKAEVFRSGSQVE